MVVLSPRRPSVQDAFAHCERLARSHYENFTVVSWFLPRTLRPSLYSIYAFCRQTDDLGDEAEGDRLALLDAWEKDLLRCYRGEPEAPTLLALQRTIQRHEIPAEPFVKLIEANRMDQRQKRYPTYGDLLRYCDHSANPVGRMVLHVFGYRDEERQRLSDATCTALQLANFWQDVRRDYAMGRIYLPLEDMERFGYTETELARGDHNGRFRDLMAFQVERARALFRQGERLASMVRRELRLDLRLFTAGGLAVLDAIQHLDYNVLTARPALSRATKARLTIGAAANLAAQRLFGAGRG